MAIRSRAGPPPCRARRVTEEGRAMVPFRAAVLGPCRRRALAKQWLCGSPDAVSRPGHVPGHVLSFDGGGSRQRRVLSPRFDIVANSTPSERAPSGRRGRRLTASVFEMIERQETVAAGARTRAPLRGRLSEKTRWRLPAVLPQTRRCELFRSASMWGGGRRSCWHRRCSDGLASTRLARRQNTSRQPRA